MPVVAESIFRLVQDSGAPESWTNLKIDSATTGINASVQNDSSVNGLGWILDSQKNTEKFEMESLALIIRSISKRVERY